MLTEDHFDKANKRIILIEGRTIRRLCNSSLLLGVVGAIVFVVLGLNDLTPLSFKDIKRWVSRPVVFWAWVALCGAGILLDRFLMNRFPEDFKPSADGLPQPIYISGTLTDFWRIPLVLIFLFIVSVAIFCIMQMPWLLFVLFFVNA